MHAPKTIRNMVGLLSATLKGEKEFTVDLPPKERTRIVIPTEDEIN